MAQIMDLFWEKGFEGTSMNDLVKTTRLNKGSLYTCFGNKEEIFKMALERYSAKAVPALRPNDSAIDVLRNFYFHIIAEVDLPKKKRRGCLLFNSCLEFGNKSTHLSPFVIAIGKKWEVFFQDLVDRAKKDGDIPNEIDRTKAAQRAFAAAFAIRELTKFKPDRDFLFELANSTLSSLGATTRLPNQVKDPI